MLRHSAMAIATILGLSTTATGMTSAANTVAINAPRRTGRSSLFDAFRFTAPMTYGHKGAGITMAQQKRAAKKARNVKRHRAACRG